MRSSLKTPKRGAAWGFISRIKPLPRKYKVPRTREKNKSQYSFFYKIYKNFYYHYHSKTGSRYVELVA